MKYLVCNKIEFGFFAFLAIGLISLSVLGFRQTRPTHTAPGRALPIYSVALAEGDRRIAYGINCAWGADDIPQILEDLDRLGVKVTFFLVGDWCDRNPEMVKELFARGHELANHSDTHPDMTTLTKEAIITELQSCSEKIAALTGVSPTLFRAPSGAYNDLVIKTARELSYDPIQWDADSVDWNGATPEQMQRRIQKTLQPGSILLFHNDTKHTAEALPLLIEQMQQDGFTIVPVGELIHPNSTTIDHTGRQHPAPDA